MSSSSFVVVMGIQNDNILWYENSHPTFSWYKDTFIRNLNELINRDALPSHAAVDDSSPEWSLLFLMDMHTQGHYCRLGTWGANIHSRIKIPILQNKNFKNISCVYHENGDFNSNAVQNAVGNAKCSRVYVCGLDSRDGISLCKVCDMICSMPTKIVASVVSVEDMSSKEKNYTHQFWKDSC